jgi:exopolysaccharide biosynthesis predicted pyruvyltransferase EpsI
VVISLDELEKKLSENRTKKFLVVEPGGNHGDRLIYWGMEKKLKELGINYTLFQYRDKREITFFYKVYWKMTRSLFKILPVVRKLKLFWMILDDLAYKWTVKEEKIQQCSAGVILIHGGANLNDIWGHGLHILRNIIKNSPRSTIIVAPQSYWFKNTQFQKLFKNTRQEIHLFARERYSYNLLCALNLPRNVHVYLSQDSAFYLSKGDFHPSSGSYDLICPRRDKESVVKWNIDLGENVDIIDLRESIENIFIGDISDHGEFDSFVKIVEGAKRVFTDRLHIAIFSTILGKDTFLYPNSYYKNKGVYEFSLRKYPTIKFIDTLEFLGINTEG